MFHVPFLRLLFLQWHHVRKHMSVTVMRHICFIECPYHKSTPPTGKLAMPNFPHYQNKKTRNKTEPKTTVHHQHYFQQTSILQLSSSSTFPKPWHLGEDNGSIRLTEGTVVQTRLLAPWKLLFSVSGFTRPFRWPESPFRWRCVFGSRFGFAFQFRGGFEKPVSFFWLQKENEELWSQVRLIHFVYGPPKKTGNPSFSGKLLVVITGSVSGNLKRHVSCQEGRWFSVSISSKRVYIYMFFIAL